MRLFKSMSVKWLILPAFILSAWPASAFASPIQRGWTIDGTNHVITMEAPSRDGFSNNIWAMTSNLASPGSGLCAGGWSGQVVFNHSSTVIGQTVTGYAYPGMGVGVSGCTAPGNYYLVLGDNPFTIVTDYYEVYYNGSTVVASLPPPPDYSTRIDSTDPAEGDNVSTTTPIYLGAIGYINIIYGDLSNVDHNEGIQVKWNVYSQAQTNNCIDVLCTVGGAGGVAGVNYYSGTGFSAFSSQDFSVSALMSDNLATGYYTLTTSIIRPNNFYGITNIFGIGFGEETLVSTSTQFTAGIPNAGQTALNNIYNATKAGVAQLTATSSAVSLASCNLFTFDIGTCLAVLFFPTDSEIQSLMQFTQSSILSRAPWGYITRMVSILKNTATTTASTALPTWVVTFPSIQGASGSPLSGSTITFDMQNMLDTGSSTLNSITDPISGKTVRQIVEPYILLFIAISALIIVFHDVMGMGNHQKYADK